MTTDIRSRAAGFSAQDKDQMRFCSLLLAILAYALFSSPTPNQPGLVEAIIGALLICAVSPSALLDVLKINKSAPLWRSAGQVFLIYGLTLCLLNAVLHGNSLGLIIRDLFPFLFLFLPLFLGDVVSKDSETAKRYVKILVLAGFLFALRSLSDFGLNLLQVFAPDSELMYLANAPTVLFASIFMVGAAGALFVKGFDMKSLLVFMCTIMAVTIPLAAMGMTLQRASIGYFALALLALSVLTVNRAPLRMGIMLSIVGLMALPFYGDVSLLGDMLIEKTTLFGLNMRSEEWQAVWAEITQGPATMLFGLGWGGTLESPAVAGVRVNFTHGLLSSMVLKTGLLGAVLCATYIVSLIKILIDHMGPHIVLVLAILGPVLIDVFLYASFKSLDFGLMLLVIPSLSALKTGDSLQAARR